MKRKESRCCVGVAATTDGVGGGASLVRLPPFFRVGTEGLTCRVYL